MDRREFIISGSRWLMAGGLVGTTGLLIHRRKFGDPDNCYVNPYCKRCDKNASCEVIAATIPDPNERQRRK